MLEYCSEFPEYLPYKVKMFLKISLHPLFLVHVYVTLSFIDLCYYFLWKNSFRQWSHYSLFFCRFMGDALLIPVSEVCTNFRFSPPNLSVLIITAGISLLYVSSPQKIASDLACFFIIKKRVCTLCMVCQD